jgi:hypothetical protein
VMGPGAVGMAKAAPNVRAARAAHGLGSMQCQAKAGAAHTAHLHIAVADQAGSQVSLLRIQGRRQQGGASTFGARVGHVGARAEP